MSTLLTPIPNRTFDRLNQMFEELFESEDVVGKQAIGVWNPAVDILENDTEYKLIMDLPGCEQKDVEVHLRGDILVISGKRERKLMDGPKEVLIRYERRHGAFSRSFVLTVPVKPDAIGARYEEGVLTVIAPKVKVPEPVKVPVLGHFVHN